MSKCDNYAIRLNYIISNAARVYKDPLAHTHTRQTRTHTYAHAHTHTHTHTHAHTLYIERDNEKEYLTGKLNDFICSRVLLISY